MIPAFNSSNVLPPYVGANPGVRGEMSPYQATMTEVVRRFATSSERVTIIEGLLAYRERLTNLGIIDGFQWIDGSFVENAEVLRGRAPADVDVVTFARRPSHVADDAAWPGFIQAHLEVFAPAQTKEQFLCDAYFVDLNKKPEIVVDDTRYWFGLFSHQRVSALWKGMVAIPLSSDDQAAKLLI